MLWKIQCFALQSMGRTNHKFPIHETRNVQTQPIYSASYLVVPTFDIVTCDDVLLPRAGSTGAIKF